MKLTFNEVTYSGVINGMGDASKACLFEFEQSGGVTYILAPDMASAITNDNIPNGDGNWYAIPQASVERPFDANDVNAAGWTATKNYFISKLEPRITMVVFAVGSRSIGQRFHIPSGQDFDNLQEAIDNL